MQHYFIIALIFFVLLCSSPQAFSTDQDEHFMDEAASAITSHEPHVALLLPLQSPIFGQAANRVKEGFIAATNYEQKFSLDIRIYGTSNEPQDILNNYKQALNAGANIVVGPLTRNGVSILASSGNIAVPTLALNTPDIDLVLPTNFFLFGLKIENEASQIAEFAMMENRHHAIIITDESPLSRRLQTSFAEQWLAKHGNTAESVKYENEQKILKQFREYTSGTDNIVFLALNATKSRWIRAYLNPKTPVYATSQLFISNENTLFNHDVNGVKFMDMPWLLQPEHPIVMVYRETIQPKSGNRGRFYALGIDAFYLAVSMLQTQFTDEISFDGVTGYIRFIPPNRFVREPLFAQFDKGKAVLLDIKIENSIDEK